MPKNSRQGEGEYEKRAAFSRVAKLGTCAGDLSSLAPQQWHFPGDERNLSFGSRIPDSCGHCGGARRAVLCLAPSRLYQGACGAAHCICLRCGGIWAASLRVGKPCGGDCGPHVAVFGWCSQSLSHRHRICPCRLSQAHLYRRGLRCARGDACHDGVARSFVSCVSRCRCWYHLVDSFASVARGDSRVARVY